MPLAVPTITADLGQANYVMGRLLSGCDCLKDLGAYLDYEETWEHAVEFGEWSPHNSAQAMPKVVVTNATFNAQNRGEDSGKFIPSGSLGVLVYIAADQSLGSESEREFAALNFFGDLVAQIMEQSGNLLNPGDQFPDRTLFINQIDLMGPTRTSQTERGPDGENDYFDGVLLIEWGQQS